MARKPNSSPQTRCVLVALAAEPAAWRHGLSLSRETGLSSGTLYPLLRRLEQQDYLEAKWQASEAPGRPPRHIYRLTAAGRRLAQESDEAGRSVATLKAQPA